MNKLLVLSALLVTAGAMRGGESSSSSASTSSSDSSRSSGPKENQKKAARKAGLAEVAGSDTDSKEGADQGGGDDTVEGRYYKISLQLGSIQNSVARLNVHGSSETFFGPHGNPAHELEYTFGLGAGGNALRWCAAAPVCEKAIGKSRFGLFARPAAYAAAVWSTWRFDTAFRKKWGRQLELNETPTILSRLMAVFAPLAPDVYRSAYPVIKGYVQQNPEGAAMGTTATCFLGHALYSHQQSSHVVMSDDQPKSFLQRVWAAMPTWRNPLKKAGRRSQVDGSGSPAESSTYSRAGDNSGKGACQQGLPGETD